MLVIVLWIVFGLVALTLYFAHSMTMELKAADNRVAGAEAEQAIEGARRYLSLMLSNNPDLGSIPDLSTYQCEAVPVGNAYFWLIGRTNSDSAPQDVVTFGLIDEASKLNLNTATSNMFVNVPRMTQDLVNNILAWRTTNTSNGGAQSDTYMRLSPPYLCKNAPFETVDELRLVYEMDMETLYGEDANLNGALDPNENDGELLPPRDNSDGRLDPGFVEYFTVYSREPTTTTNGTTRANLTTLAGVQSLQTNLNAIFGNSQAMSFLTTAGFFGPPGRGQRGGPTLNTNALVQSPLQFFTASKMTPVQFALVEPSIRGSRTAGLVNVNTASTAVLACLPGMDYNTAAQITSYRQANQSNANNRNTVSWIANVVTDPTILSQIAPWITGRSYQFMADVAAVGHNGRGYRRVRFVYDVSGGAPKILYRQDLTHLGWALGKQVRNRALLAKQ